MQKFSGLLNRMKTFFEGGIEDEEWAEEGDYDYYDEPQEPEYDYDEEGIDLAGAASASRTEKSKKGKKGSNVLEFDNKRSDSAQITVRIVRPKEMQDATMVCEYLQDGRICIIDMQLAEHATAQRIADYLGGVSYALRGAVERVDSYIFVMAPEGVRIDTELKEELKSGGLFRSFM